jgi:hypothetical protein
MNDWRPWQRSVGNTFVSPVPVRVPRWAVLAFSALTVARMFSVPAAAQAQETGRFALLVGQDTLAVEQYTRRADRVSGELSGPTLGRIVYDVAVEPDAMLGDLTIEFWTPGAPDEAAPNQVASIEVDADTVVVRITTPPGIGEQRLPTMSGAFPYINPSFVQIEQMVRRARRMGGAVAEFPVLLALGQETISARVLDAASDSVTIMIGSEIHAVVDAEGRLQSANLPYQGFRVVRMD